MPEVALTIAFFFALLRGSLHGRRTLRGRRIFRNRHGIFFRNRFRQPFFHPHRRSRRNGFAGRRGRGRVGGRRGHGGLRDARQARLDLDRYRRMSAAINRRRRRRQQEARLNAHRLYEQQHARRRTPLAEGVLPAAPFPLAQRLPTPTPNPTAPTAIFGVDGTRMGDFFTEAGPSTISSFTAAAHTSTTAPPSRGDDHIAPPVPEDGGVAVPVADDEEPVEVEAATTTSSSPSPPRRTPRARRNARIRVGERGRPSERIAPRLPSPTAASGPAVGPSSSPAAGPSSTTAAAEPSTPPSSPSSFTVITGSEEAAGGMAGSSHASAAAAPGAAMMGDLPSSARSPIGGRLLSRFLGLQRTPPRRPGREPGAWTSTARHHADCNGYGHGPRSDGAGPSRR